MYVQSHSTDKSHKIIRQSKGWGVSCNREDPFRLEKKLNKWLQWDGDAIMNIIPLPNIIHSTPINRYTIEQQSSP